LTGKSCRLKNLINSFNFNENLKIIPCPQLVEAIEYNYPRNKVLDVLEKILHDFLHKKNLTIILGCTHYEYVKSEISFLLNGCEIFNGSVGVSKQIIKSHKITGFQNNKIKNSKIFSTSKNMYFLNFYINKLNLDMVDCSFIEI
jgi:glutamate racemase